MTQHQQQPAAANTETPTTRTRSDKASGPLRTPSRWWSRRRIPAAIVALVLSAACGALLFDTVRVRTGHTASAWRKSLTHELATRPLNDPWILTGAALSAALGLWLLVIAFTPGHRRLLPWPGQTQTPTPTPTSCSTAAAQPCCCATQPCEHPASPRPGSEYTDATSPHAHGSDSVTPKPSRKS